MRLYMATRYRKRRQEAFLFLGEKCKNCGSRDNLQFDHIDPKTKEFTIAEIWLHSKIKFWKEIEKCQILCQPCHNQKTLKELGLKSAKGNHGTLSTYRYCHCGICRQANNDWHKVYKRTRSSAVVAGRS